MMVGRVVDWCSLFFLSSKKRKLPCVYIDIYSLLFTHYIRSLHYIEHLERIIPFLVFIILGFFFGTLNIFERVVLVSKWHIIYRRWSNSLFASDKKKHQFFITRCLHIIIFSYYYLSLITIRTAPYINTPPFSRSLKRKVMFLVFLVFFWFFFYTG